MQNNKLMLYWSLRKTQYITEVNIYSLNLSQMLWSECKTRLQNAHILIPGIKSGRTSPSRKEDNEILSSPLKYI